MTSLLAAAALGGVALLALGSLAWLRLRAARRRAAATQAHDRHRLLQAQQCMRMLLDHLPDAVIAIDARGRIESINPAGEAMFGASQAALVGAAVSGLIPGLGDELDWPDTEPQADPAALGAAAALPGRARRFALEGRRARMGAEAVRFPVDVSLVQSRTDGERGVICIARDLSALERIERMKREFISMVSHELRTPLTSIHAALMLLGEQGAEVAPPLQRLVNLARANSERMVALVNDILDYERLRAGDLRIEALPLDLRAAARAASEACAQVAQSQSVRIVLETGARALPVLADPLRLNQVLVNLLSNAVTFSPPDGEVAFSLQHAGACARIRVGDDGPGVAPALVERLFDPFVQGVDLDTRGAGGPGLGLAISRALLERMGGDIGLEPPLPGRGAVFWITLPLQGG